MRSPRNLLALAVALILFAAPPQGRAQVRGVVVNGVELERSKVVALQSAYRTHIAAGRYWYDRRSGLWGFEGGPNRGQLPPGLDLGGPLHPRASVGSRAGITGVFVNGRELHPQELAYLQRLYGHVNRSRYWLDARGIGGYEGQPAQFDLRAQATRARGHTSRGLFGSTGSDGRCSYYNDPSSGASVMTGDC